MPHFTTQTREILVARIESISRQIANAHATLERLLAQEIESYRLDTGEGSQQAKRASTDHLDKLIARLETRAEHYRQRLAGLGVTAMTVRRFEDR